MRRVKDRPQIKAIADASREIGGEVVRQHENRRLIESHQTVHARKMAMSGARVALEALFEAGIEIPEGLLTSKGFVHDLRQVANNEAEEHVDELHLGSF